MNNNEYRLMPVALLPAIRDALVETGKCLMPDHVWAAVIEAHDRVTPAGNAANSAMPAAFGDWFKANYPADTLIHDPEWHAPKIYWRAVHATAPERSETPADEGQSYCLSCRGEGAVRSGIGEASESLCNACSGTGYQSRCEPEEVSSSAAPIDGMHASIFVKVWGDAGGGDAGRIALAQYAYDLGKESAIAATSPTGESLSAERSRNAVLEEAAKAMAHRGWTDSASVICAMKSDRPAPRDERREIFDAAMREHGFGKAHASYEHCWEMWQAARPAASPVELTDAQIDEICAEVLPAGLNHKEYDRAIARAVERHLAGDTATTVER